jgi:RimJ/RimL family protein N-acetyltransferase
LATEGAKRCLDYGLQELALEKIIAVAPVINIPSIKVMQKIGMKKVKEFKHPKLIDYTTLVNCVLYESELG